VNTTHSILLILVMAAVTLLTRALPFLLFDRGGEPPRLILYLGRVLPPAVIAMLVIYCLRSLSFSAVPSWLPQLLAVAVVVILHKWKHNTLLSIFGGTVLYMILVQVVFPG
jgi:branched-subunit amino acid transport protein AzlD